MSPLPPGGAAAEEPPASPADPGQRKQVLAFGELVGRYQVRRLLGQGGMGQVYLARDVMLGRSIALKVVRLERGGAADSQRFAEEARLLAALNHPHVVQLHDAGVHRGHPYLALEYVEGETLDGRGAAPSLDEALRLTRAIADALTHAHANGILHCDLKPTNLLLGADGRLRVVDFGLARRVTGATTTPEGTPEWMAPEQWQRRSLTEHVDVWALALVLLHLLGEPHPFAPLDASWLPRLMDPGEAPRLPVRADLSATLGELLARSFERDPQHRPSAREWLFALEEALAGRDVSQTPEGPYRGLSPFGEQHARDFFGRDAEVDAFIERLRAVTLLPIVGPSGVGKSSFLYAGVIPRLRARNAWTVISLRPGAAPIEALARRLLAIGHLGDAPTLDLDLDDVTGISGFAGGRDEPEVRALAQELRTTPALLAVRLAALASARSGGVLLAIDQLEELFTHGASEDDVSALLAMLLQAADDPRESIRVVTTVRDDFVGRFTGLRELFVLRPLGPTALRLAITGPLRRTGCNFDDAEVIEEMLAELGAGAAAELPLLQFACRALWEERDVEKRLLLRVTYDRIGGVAGALARHADGVIDGMTAAEQGLARQVFLRLVVGTARRTMPRPKLEAELASDANLPDPQLAPVLDRLLDRLVASRLVVQRTSMDGVAVMEIIHEALLRSWGRLQRWLEETRDERRLIAELEQAAELWRKRGKRLEETWPVEEIGAARHRFKALGLHPPEAIEEFLAAGEQRDYAKRRRARRKRVLAAVGALAITSASVLLAGEFRRQKVAAEQQAEALRLAGSNLGPVELVLQPFDWGEGAFSGPVDLDAAMLPALSWRVYGARPGDEHHPGAELPAELVRRQGSSPAGQGRLDRVELPGGTAFFRIDGRGRDGQVCAPSWIRVQALPGYAARQQPSTRITLRIPSCAASAAGMITIEAGPFIYGGRGERADDPGEPEATVVLPRFAIDRTEVSNAQFAPFASMRAITGYPVPDYPKEGIHAGSDGPNMPLTAVDVYEAEAFCRYLGKRLPSDHEWVKAARGGLEVAGVPNPYPRRLYPWGPERLAQCSNDWDKGDGYGWVAPVDAMPCGASPYGVLNLVGNAAEWIGREGQVDRDDTKLWVIRGGELDLLRSVGASNIVARNLREGRQFNFAVGLRCVSGGGAP